MDQFLFADEAGCLTFKRCRGASRYFILVSVYLEDCQIGHDLLSLKRQMAWEDLHSEYFHATSDTQAVRDRVFAFLQDKTFRVDATLLDKVKAQPKIRTDEPTFYKYAWYYHLQHVAPRVVRRDKRLLISPAAIGTKKRKEAFLEAVRAVARQTINRHTPHWKTSFCPASSDPCLQIADYCAWAIQRKWEVNDTRSYDLISSKIRSEYDLFRAGRTEYF